MHLKQCARKNMLHCCKQNALKQLRFAFAGSQRAHQSLVWRGQGRATRSVHLQSAAMRALAAILILSACSRLHAQPSGLKTFKNILDCAFTIGSVKCLNALSVWRAKRAINQPNLKSNITHDLEQFPWMNYRNNTEEELYSELCDGTEQLLQRRSMTLSVIPGYRLELLSKGNGMLNVDVYKSEWF